MKRRTYDEKALELLGPLMVPVRLYAKGVKVLSRALAAAYAAGRRDLARERKRKR